MSVILETSLGDLCFDLYCDKAPLTTQNFLKLCRLKYYNNCLFYEVQRDFIARSGDPSNTGLRGDSIYNLVLGRDSYFKSEVSSDLKHNKFGLLVTANDAPDHNNSQFFVVLSKRHLDSLDGKHTIFGELVEGFDVLEKINRAIVDDVGRPIQNVIIEHTLVVDDPTPELEGWRSPSRSPSPKKDQAQSGRIAANVDLDELVKGKTEQELKEEAKRHETKRNQEILVVLEDIPDADIKPPENVLFICKLNPVTQERDLQSLFRRFGKITSVDVIRDWKTGDSLEYAFLQFQKEESAIEAYFKMNNALVDERRIKVDFSQSVAKLWHKYKGQRLQDYVRPSAVTRAIERGEEVNQRQRSRERQKTHEQKRTNAHYRERKPRSREREEHYRRSEKERQKHRERDRERHREAGYRQRDSRRQRERTSDRNRHKERRDNYRDRKY